MYGVPSAGSMFVFLVFFYLLGIFFFVTTITVVHNKFAAFKISLWQTFFDSFIGGIIGASLALIIYLIWVPNMPIYGAEGYSEEFRKSTTFTRNCIYFPIIIILIAFIYSFLSQKKTKKIKVPVE